ncbi:MAG: threonine synthase [Candidatus Methanomethylicota archaeon]|uniref:Threonine synthase n=1 Tax=Thermoproteota archaeon TaxID=2056631 RepID=A0A497F534_9CREN|nr:MAG: threonine synthase [Candidatus Verstraetearchaeota archaeon]
MLEKRVDGIWKYIELLPCLSSSAISLGEGNTELLKCDKLGRKLGIRKLYVKDETKNPTGSFMDRGASVLITRLCESGFRGVYGIFKGNLGASLAAYSAKAGLKCTVFISERIDASKLYQMIAYGATIYPENKLEEIKFGDRHYLADNADPFLLEGEKTIGFEIIENFDWHLSDFIIAPMGTGGLISALWKAIKEFEILGLISEFRSKLIGVQSEQCAPIVDKFISGEAKEVDVERTLAVDIAFEKPSRDLEAIKALKESEGYAFKVSDEEMLLASMMLAKMEGVFAEPAAASTIACVKRMIDEGFLDPSDSVVCVITGSGLKDPVAAVKELEKNLTLEKFIKLKVRMKPRLGIGSTKIRILKLLSDEKLHGYDVWKKLCKSGFDISIPAVYQHLKELEQMGLISRVKSEVVEGRVRTYYAITSKGVELLRALT